jgi:hypothetical protein
LAAGTPWSARPAGDRTGVELEEFGRGAQEEGSPGVADVHETCDTRRHDDPEQADGKHGCLLDVQYNTRPP